MPTSQKQITANKKNTQKSTSPKSPHLDEDPREYRQFLDSMLDDLKTGEITEPSTPAPRSRVPKNEQTNPFEKAKNQTPPDSELTFSQNDIPTGGRLKQQ